MHELEPEKAQPINCYICKRTGEHRRWELCDSSHYEFLCFDCATGMDLAQCPIRDCSGKTLATIIRDVATSHQRWMKNLASNMTLLTKYEAVSEALTSLHQDTRQPFQQAVDNFLKTKSGVTRKLYFQNYLEKLTKYIICVRLGACRDNLTHLIEDDDRLNTELNARLTAYESHVETIAKAKVPPKKEAIKLEKYPINCLICFNNYNVLYKWTYCENDHLHNSICRDCLYKVRECPVCRGKLRTPIIKACEDSMLDWDATLNQHLSIHDMINLLMRDTLSSGSRQTIFAKLQRENSRIKPIEFGDYTNLVQNLSMEWCREMDSEKYERIFKMIEAYEQEYDLVINLKKVIEEKLAEYSKRFDNKKVVEVSDDSSSIESSDKSDVQQRRNNRVRNRRNFSSVDSDSSIRSRGSSRSRGPRAPLRRDPRLHRSRSRSRSRSRERPRVMASPVRFGLREARLFDAPPPLAPRRPFGMMDRLPAYHQHPGGFFY